MIRFLDPATGKECRTCPECGSIMVRPSKSATYELCSNCGAIMPDQSKHDLSTHFQLSEFDQPAGHDLPAAKYPTEWIRERLIPLALILEQLRGALGDRPMRVISGYRSPAYNRKIGGARLSQHMEGRAADIIVEGVAPAAVHAKALDMYRAGALSIGGLGEYPTFTHVDIRDVPRLATWRGSRMA